MTSLLMALDHGELLSRTGLVTKGEEMWMVTSDGTRSSKLPIKERERPKIKLSISGRGRKAQGAVFETTIHLLSSAESLYPAIGLCCQSVGVLQAPSRAVVLVFYRAETWILMKVSGTSTSWRTDADKLFK
jgi:hypothetical protein